MSILYKINTMDEMHKQMTHLLKKEHFKKNMTILVRYSKYEDTDSDISSYTKPV